ncbi:hypothetical protein IFM89_038053 [Coptis chinensis]|uniref:Uncharacterized protein n=1 Tax=Coptis chinensis TaxID=261450 RepID=A0A835H9H6_9MAGN|nr:hypothetical protein IFM89_038053 [Coptis chinensis]
MQIAGVQVSNLMNAHTDIPGYIKNMYVFGSSGSWRADPYPNHKDWSFDHNVYGRLELAWEILGKLMEEDVVSWTATIYGYVQQEIRVGLVNKGLSYLKSMSIEHGIVPGPEHYAGVVDVLGRAAMLGSSNLQKDS